MGSSKGKLHRSLVFLAVVAFVVLVVSLACWFYFFQADRVGIAGKTKTVMLLEANPLVQPVVFGLDGAGYEHTEPVGVFGKFAGNHVRAWFQPPEGQTQIYYRKFVEAGKKQGLCPGGSRV